MFVFFIISTILFGIGIFLHEKKIDQRRIKRRGRKQKETKNKQMRPKVYDLLDIYFTEDRNNLVYIDIKEKLNMLYVHIDRLELKYLKLKKIINKNKLKKLKKEIKKERKKIKEIEKIILKSFLNDLNVKIIYEKILKV